MEMIQDTDRKKQKKKTMLVVMVTILRIWDHLPDNGRAV
jgi:hypothetical protein